MLLYCPSDRQQTTWQLASGDSLALHSLDWTAGEQLQWDFTHDAHHDIIYEVQLFVLSSDEPVARLLCSAMPALTTRFVVSWNDLDGETVFLKRTPGRGKMTMFVEHFQPSALERMVISIGGLDHAVSCSVSDPCISSGPVEYPLPEAPLVDAFGQWIPNDWPGKCTGLDDLRDSIHVLEQAARPWPLHFSPYGGDERVRYEATGFFRVGAHKGRPCLIDPAGHPFWSTGVDCVNPGVATEVVEGTEALFAAWPDPETDGADLVRPGRWHDQAIDFGRWNLQRVYGERWREHWQELVAALLRDAGFNTIGNWSSTETARKAGLPYVVPMPDLPMGTGTLFRDLPDVFDPAWEAALVQWANFLQPYADDPCLLGYFLGNEPQWGFGTFNLAAEMLARRPGSHSRRVMAQWLRERYAQAADLQAAWGGAVSDFDDVINRELPGIADATTQAAQDCWAFGACLVEQLVGATSKAARAVAPHHLNLGNRWAWIASDLAYAGHEHLDVFSINCYAREPEVELIETIRRKTGKPVMIGEWHIGAVDRGPLGSGLQAVPSQADRGLAYRAFLETAASIPGLVGAHWFQLYDQAPLGRFDGENWNIGLLDICSRPYPELVAGARASHERLYDLVYGDAAPIIERPAEAAKIAN